MAVGGFDHFSTGGAKIICLRSMTVLHHNDVMQMCQPSLVFKGRDLLYQGQSIRCDDGRNDYGHNFLQIPLLKTHLRFPLLIF